MDRTQKEHRVRTQATQSKQEHKKMVTQTAVPQTHGALFDVMKALLEDYEKLKDENTQLKTQVLAFQSEYVSVWRLQETENDLVEAKNTIKGKDYHITELEEKNNEKDLVIQDTTEEVIQLEELVGQMTMGPVENVCSHPGCERVLASHSKDFADLDKCLEHQDDEFKEEHCCNQIIKNGKRCTKKAGCTINHQL